MIATIVIWAVLIVIMLAYGHGMAVEKSEYALRRKLGNDESSEATRKLLREAGYRV